MQENLLNQLELLEQDYFDQPSFQQKKDLVEINKLRSQLGKSLVDCYLREINQTKEETPIVEIPNESIPDYDDMREIYKSFRKKKEKLEIYKAYARRVGKATRGAGMTPVKPLATMGPNGGPLLCDICNKPMILEGGSFHKVYADVAWKRNPKNDWVSFISGGMVVEIQTNGTLRIYHGYIGRCDSHCCNIASKQDEEARSKHKIPKGSERILPFLEQEFPDKTDQEREDLFNEIYDVMYKYDPGFGVNFHQ